MKTFLRLKSVSVLLFTLALLASLPVLSQGIPQLQFTNPVLESGTAGADGASYRFSLVTSGVDAVVTIKGRSSAAVVLSSIDTVGAGLGYDKAFQPVLGIPGIAPALSKWWMDFQITFYQTGTTKKVKLSQFNVTGLDIDGDGSTLSEWTQMNEIQSIDSAIVNSLTFTRMNHGSHGDDYKVEGIIANSPGIDTTAKNVMATYKYVNTDQITFTIGAKTSLLPTTAGVRLNSIWFRDFLGMVLPVKFISFSAMLNTGKVDLQWTTASEMNVSHFVIEKSNDGKTFTDAGLVFANGNTTQEMQYSFTDKLTSNEKEIIYYRLRSVDIDGQFDYSQTNVIKNFKVADNMARIATYPNPAIDAVHINLPAEWQNKMVSLNIIKINGQLLTQTTIAAAGHTETLSLKSLEPGMYIISLKCESKIIQQKIIKS